MKIGIAQINPTVGDLDGNLEIILDAYHALSKKGAELIIFPELALCGYPPRDLLLKRRFGGDCADSLNKFVEQTGPCPALLGFPELGELTSGKNYFNSAALCADKKIQKIFRKRLLPTYDVFDEQRYFAEGDSSMCFEYLGKRIGVSICEDIWNTSGHLHSLDPLESLADEKINLLINLSASPWHLGKCPQRISILKTVAKKFACPVVYVNAVGGNDELIFDGGSIVMDPSGSIHQSVPSFVSDCQLIDLSEIKNMPQSNSESLESIRQALVLGLRDYAHKSGFQKGLIGLSGGIDSAVTATIATEALGKENIIGISLPSRISSEHSKSDAEALANIGWIQYKTGKDKQAVENLQKSYNIDPQPQTAAHLSEVLWHNGQKDSAEAIWQSALMQHPNNATLLEMHRLFERAP